jgi:hypothetical protein
VLAAVAVAGLLSTGCAEQSAALRVGDRTVSESDLIDELDTYGANESLWQASGQPAPTGELTDSWDQNFVASILEQRVVLMLAGQMFDEQGLSLDDSARSGAEQRLGQQFGPGFDEFPDDYRQAFIDDVARADTLSESLGDDFESALIDEAADTDIEVSSRFGSWDQDGFRVIPPEGPAPAPGGATDVPVDLG